MGARKSDPFKATRPKTQNVAVGDHTMTLKTATLDQEARFLEVIEGLDLHKLFKPVGDLIAKSQENGETGFLDAIAQNGADLWGAARVVLGKQLAPSIQTASIALLDSELNMNLLMDAELIPADSDVDAGSDGEFLGCRETRLFLKRNLTMLQGVNVITAAWTINNYGDLLGNMLAPMAAVPTK